MLAKAEIYTYYIQSLERHQGNLDLRCYDVDKTSKFDWVLSV